MPWYRVQFNQGEVTDGAAERFSDALFQAFVAQGWPRDAATFVTTPPGGRAGAPLTGVAYYVSPRGADLGREVLVRFAGQECGPPPLDQATPCLYRGCADDAVRLLLRRF